MLANSHGQPCKPAMGKMQLRLLGRNTPKRHPSPLLHRSPLIPMSLNSNSWHREVNWPPGSVIKADIAGKSDCGRPQLGCRCRLVPSCVTCARPRNYAHKCHPIVLVSAGGCRVGRAWDAWPFPCRRSTDAFLPWRYPMQNSTSPRTYAIVHPSRIHACCAQFCVVCVVWVEVVRIGPRKTHSFPVQQ
jgi:hypothetical protein